MSEKIKVLFYNRDVAGVNYFRTQTVAQQLERDHSDKFRVEINQSIDFNDPNVIEYLKSFHVIHYHRELAPNINDAIRVSNILRQEGVTLIMDVDDYWHLDKTHPFYRLSVQQKLHEKIIDNLKLADYITTTTELFAKEIRKITGKDNVSVFPNAIDPTWMKQFQNNWKPDPNGLVRIGYMAGSCYDDQTEILTENGWKLFSDLNFNEKVATLNPITNELEYQRPTNYTNEYYEGEMYYGVNRNIDFAVTPNHNMFVNKTKNGKRKKPFNFELIRMDELDDYDLTFKKSCNWNGQEIDNFIIHKYSGKRKKFDEITFKMDDWLMFFGFWLGDGWTTNDGSNQVGICAVREDSFLRMKEIEKMLRSYGYNPTMTNDNKQLRIFNQQLWNYLSQFGKSYDKFIPKDIKNLSSRQLTILYDNYIITDGHTRPNGRKTSYSVSRQLSDDLSEIALKIGTCSTFKNCGIKESTFIREKVNIHGNIVKYEEKVKGTTDSYTTNYYLTGTKKSQLEPTLLRKNIEKKFYFGNIYCVTVPNHIIYVRRNGKSYWCGNSHNNDMQQLRGVVNRLESDPQTKGKFKIVIAGWDTEGTTTDIKFNQEFKIELEKRRLWNKKIIKAINNSNGNIDAIPNLPSDIVEKFRGQVFLENKRKIHSEESVYLNYEKILTDDYRLLKDDKEYLKWLGKYERGVYENEKRFARRWTEKANVYAKVLDEIDISLAPLADNMFNKMKSNLKQVECWSRKLAIVCTDIPPYNVDGVHEHNCMLVPNKKNAEKYWFKYLKRLITDENFRKQLGENLYQDFSEKYNLKNVTDNRAKFYENAVMEKFEVA